MDASPTRGPGAAVPREPTRRPAGIDRPEARPSPRRTPWIHVVLAIATFASLSACWAAIGEGVPPWRLDRGATYALAVLAVLGAHEFGHYVACRVHGVSATLPYFLPGFPLGTFGAVIRVRQIVPDRRALFDIAAAGPIAGFAVAMPLLIHGVWTAAPLPVPPAGADPVGLRFGHSALTWAVVEAVHGRPGILVGPTYVAAWFGLLVTSMNLFPVGQLDGGHAAFAVSRRVHRGLAWITILGLITWVAASSLVRWEPSPYVLWCAVLLFLRARHPPVLDPSTPLDRRRRVVAIALAAMFLATFMPLPLRLG